MNLEQLLEARRVAGLIIGFIQHTLTPQQEKELDEWIGESDEHMRLFGDLTDERKVKTSMAWFTDLDRQTALFNVQQTIAAAEEERQRTSNDQNKRRNRMLILSFCTAACVLAVCGVLIINYYSRSRLIPGQQVASVYPVAKVIGKESVSLTTSDGRTVNLQQVKAVSLNKDLAAQNNADVLTYPENSLAAINTLNVPTGRQYTVQLSDGTRIMLNAQSSLQYPSGFAKGPRKVVLQGEGYFEVAKDAARPFFVQINGTTVEVTGTRFNVHGYATEPGQVITLLDGGINVQSGKMKKLLKPNDVALVARGSIDVSKAAVASENIAWTNGDFTFQDATIETIMQELSRWYGMEVKYAGHPNDQFSGTISRSSSIQQVLHMLELAGRAHFSVSDHQVIVRP